MMRYYLLSMLLLSVLSISVDVAAAPALWRECHNCSNADYANAAMSATNASAKVFVFDLGRGNLRKFMVEVEHDVLFWSVHKSALPGTVGSRKLEQWEEALETYEAFLNGPIQSPPVGETAYDVFNDQNAHQDLMDYYRQLRGWMWHWDRIQMVATAIQHKISSLQYIIVFQWPDGSFMRLRFVNFDTVTGVIQVVADYAEDADGNVIHSAANANGYVGDTGVTSNPGELTDYWSQIGIQWSVGGGQIPTGRCSFRCTANECILQCSDE